MKKIICAILSVLLTLSLAACGNQKAKEASGLEEGGDGYTMNPDLIAKNTEGKTKLTLACFVLMPDIEERIINFNNTNQDYYIEVLDYSQYDTEDDFSAGETKLNTDILGGNTPDMIELGKRPIEKYTNKGLLQDLNGFLETDPECSKDDLLPGAYQALSSENGLYRIAPSFTVVGLYGRESVIGAEQNWNIAEMQNTLTTKQEVANPFINMPPVQVLQSLTMYTLDSFIDRKEGSGNFNSSEFIQLLETVKKFGQANQEDYLETNETLMNNKGLLATIYLSTIDQYAKIDDELSGDFNVIGFPTDNGSGNVADFQFSFGMFADSEHKEGCWQFLKSFLEQDYQQSIAKFEIPVLQSAFIQMLSSSNATQEQKDQYEKVINAITKTADFDGTLLGIIEEEAQQFLDGARSSEETAKAIQSRVAIYLSENS